jgi:hypothetical protein
MGKAIYLHILSYVALILISTSPVTAQFWPGDLVPNVPGVHAKIEGNPTWPNGNKNAGDAVTVNYNIFVDGTYAGSHTFYCGYSVLDPNGQPWDIPYQALTLYPNDRRTVSLTWTVPSDAPKGKYTARVAVWEDVQPDGFTLVNRFDMREQQCFSVGGWW